VGQAHQAADDQVEGNHRDQAEDVFEGVLHDEGTDDRLQHSRRQVEVLFLPPRQKKRPDELQKAADEKHGTEDERGCPLHERRPAGGEAEDYD
jgi:hypothetical protein